jgi:hypothetical protein
MKIHAKLYFHETWSNQRNFFAIPCQCTYKELEYILHFFYELIIVSQLLACLYAAIQIIDSTCITVNIIPYI